MSFSNNKKAENTTNKIHQYKLLHFISVWQKLLKRFILLYIIEEDFEA
jgi:hypothetical protein